MEAFMHQLHVDTKEDLREEVSQLVSKWVNEEASN
jgi:hypothetical protein